MTYKAIGFDWGGVINGKPGKFFGIDISKLLGISESKFQEAYFHHNIDFNRALISEEELWTKILQELELSSRFEEVMNFVHDSREIHLNDGVVGLVDKLKENGYKVGLLSNNTLEYGQEIRATGLDKHFDVFHISAETGVVKPEPKSFIRLSEDLGVNPTELIFVDDSQKSLSTSGEVGFTPLLYDNLEQCLDELKTLGISL